MNLSTKRSFIDYTQISTEPKDYYEYYLIFFFVAFAVAMLFYDDVWTGLLLFCFSPLFEKSYGRYQRDKRIKEIREEFKDCLYTIASSVAAGRQMPQAILDAKEQSELFFGNDSDISIELDGIYSRYKGQNEDLSIGLLDFAKRSGVDEISLFAESFAICKRTGGNLEQICLKSAYMIIQKIEFASEVQSILSEKKLDAIIMTMMPLVVLFFLNISSPNYIAVLYQGFQGRIIMSVALLLMIIAMLWSLRIMKLKI